MNFFSLYIPDRRVDELRCSLIELFSHLPKVTARKLAQCVGKLISMMPVIGNIARLLLRCNRNQIILGFYYMPGK